MKDPPAVDIRLQSIEQFAHAANQFAAWATQQEDSGAVAARNALRHITELYLAALALPASAGSADAPDVDVDSAERNTICANCARLPLDYYGEIFDPLTMPPPEPVVGSVADDIADIYREVVTGLRHYRAGRTDAAVWQWTFLFQVHWGEHAIGAIRALHAWLAANEGFTTTSLNSESD
jgi:hypothetical protein